MEMERCIPPFHRVSLTGAGAVVLLAAGSASCHAGVARAARAGTLSDHNALLAMLGLAILALLPLWVAAMWFPGRHGTTTASRHGGRTATLLADWLAWCVPVLILLATGAMVWVLISSPEHVPAPGAAFLSQQAAPAGN